MRAVYYATTPIDGGTDCSVYPQALLKMWGGSRTAVLVTESSQAPQIYIYGSRETQTVYMANLPRRYVCSSSGYPQKGVLIHSYKAVFHTCARQILACLYGHPPYMGYEVISVKWVIHK
jgi:hypothetical protein